MPRLFFLVLLATLALVGCNARVPAPGGAQGSKPDQARKQTEALALNAVTGAANAQAKTNPSLTRGGTGWLGKLAIAPGAAVSGASTTVPPAANPPVGPAPAPPASGQAAPQDAPPKAPPQPKANPRPGSPPVIKERVVGALPYATEAEAEEDAVNVARDLLGRRFAELDPPVKYRPSANEVKNEFTRRETRTARQPDQAERELFAKNGITGNLVYVEFDVEVTADQVRELRTRDRVGSALRLFGAMATVALAGFLFLRADERTKGYLTRWLAAGAVLVAGGVAAALYFV
jgi:hypothetical protein